MQIKGKDKKGCPDYQVILFYNLSSPGITHNLLKFSSLFVIPQESNWFNKEAYYKQEEDKGSENDDIEF